jgi:hypothetical protein
MLLPTVADMGNPNGIKLNMSSGFAIGAIDYREGS